MSGILLDTHTWIWFALGDKKIKPKLRSIIEKAADKNELFLANISTWEMCMLENRKKITLSMPRLEWINHSIKQLNLSLLDLQPNIAFDSCNLPGDFHGDPADRIIVATARHYQLNLVTADKKILSYSEKNHLKTIEI